MHAHGICNKCKSFLRKHGISTTQPSKRESFLCKQQWMELMAIDWRGGSSSLSPWNCRLLSKAISSNSQYSLPLTIDLEKDGGICQTQMALSENCCMYMDVWKKKKRRQIQAENQRFPPPILLSEWEMLKALMSQTGFKPTQAQKEKRWMMTSHISPGSQTVEAILPSISDAAWQSRLILSLKENWQFMVRRAHTRQATYNWIMGMGGPFQVTPSLKLEHIEMPGSRESDYWYFKHSISLTLLSPVQHPSISDVLLGCLAPALPFILFLDAVKILPLHEAKARLYIWLWCDLREAPHFPEMNMVLDTTLEISKMQ